MSKFLTLLLIFFSFQSCKEDNDVNFTEMSGTFNENIRELRLRTNQKFQRNKHIDINLSHSDGNFHDTFKINEGYYDLIINDRTILLYLKNGYNLNLDISEDNINIEGTGRKPSIYLQNRVDLEKDLSSKNFNHYYANLKETAFIKLADSIYNLRINLIQNSKLENSKFKFIEESLAKLDRSHKFINYPFSRLRIDPTYSSSHHFPETFKDIDINDEKFVDIPHYSLLMFLKIVDAVTKESNQSDDPILGYLNFVLNGNLQVTNRKLKEEIAYETVSLTMEKTDSLDKLFETYKNFSEDSIYLKEITNKYIKLKGVPKGSAAPNFSIQNANGDLISLEEFKGNVVYIDFWATWCKPCLSEINPSRELQKKLADYDIKFINIGIESKYNTWSNLIFTKNIEGINLFANNEIEKKIKEDYFIQGLPRYVIIDKDGRIFDFSAKKPSDPKLEGELKSIL